AERGKGIPVESAQPGDLLFYASGDYINHVALYIGGGQVIHASNATTGIIISPYNYRTPCKAVTFLD
ncbi:hydrolase, partial [Klebsiella oxytoca]